MRRYRSFICDSARWEDFDLHPGDIVVTTPPKCGTTWMQTLCLLLVHGAPLPAALSDLSAWLDQELKSMARVRAMYDAQPHRRVIKTHTPMDGIPWRDDVTYVGVGRDPRDVALSAKDHSSNMDMDAARTARDAAGAPPLPTTPDAPPPMPRTVQTWIEDDKPIEQFGSSLAFTVHHLEQLWTIRDRPNVLLFHYGTLRSDLPGSVRRLAAGLRIDLDDETLAAVVAAATFESMRDDADRSAPNTTVSLWRDNRAFFAEGHVGAWRDQFTTEELATYEERIVALRPDESLRAWLHDG
jgi:hypothetical protein